MALKITPTLLLSAFLILPASSVQAESEGQVTVYHNQRPQIVKYHFLPPSGRADKLSPVIICADGLNQRAGTYIHSGTERCFQYWREFAEAHSFGLLNLGFLFVPEDWNTKESYQFAQAWSGRAAVEVVDKIAAQELINSNELYVFGISAGAQFAVRFAFYAPQKVRAVAAHAAGGYDTPATKIPTKFLITVGEKDNQGVTRVEWAQYFVGEALKSDIDVRLDIIPGIAHEQTEVQNQMSREFFLQTAKDIR